MTTGVMSTRRMAVTGIFFAISVGLVVLLLRQISLEDFRRLASQLTVWQFLFLSGIYLLMAYVRGIRLGYVIRDRTHGKLTAISVIHAFLNHVLPFRLGELSLPVLVKAFTRHGLATGSLTLVVVRLYELVSIALLSVVSLLVVGGELSPAMRQLLWGGAIGAGVGFLLLFRYLGGMIRLAGGVAAAVLAACGAKGREAGVRVREGADRMDREIEGFDRMQKYVLLPATSLAVTCLTYVLFYFAMVFMGIDIGFFKNMLASLGELVTTFLPNSLGSFGTMEAGWAAGYALCGVSKADAIASGFIMHGIIILAGALFSAVSVAVLLAARKRGAA